MDERTLDELMKLDIEERWRLMLAEVDDLIADLEQEKQDREAG